MSEVVSSRVGVGIIVERETGQILLGYRNKADESPCWCLPGGHVEQGESFSVAALRELHEETGIFETGSVTVFSVFQNLTSPAPAITAGILVSVREQNTQPVVTEPEVFSCWRWFSLSDLPEPLFPASDALLNAFKNQPVPQGWISYPIHVVDEHPQSRALMQSQE
ncbi:nucleotide triphosphate diphosphatase NUDT15 [Kushneria sp. EE4]